MIPYGPISVISHIFLVGVGPNDLMTIFSKLASYRGAWALAISSQKQLQPTVRSTLLHWREMILVLVLLRDRRTVWSNVVSLSCSALVQWLLCRLVLQCQWNLNIRKTNMVRISYPAVLQCCIANNSLWDASPLELRVGIQDVGLGIIRDTGGECVCVLMTVIWGRSLGVTTSSPPWVIHCCLCFCQLVGLVQREETNPTCGTADKTSTYILTNTEWKDCNWMLFFSLPFNTRFHVLSLQTWELWEASLRFTVSVILDDLERCFAFCKSRILIFLYPLTCIERFYNNLIRGLYFFFLGGIILIHLTFIPRLLNPD